MSKTSLRRMLNKPALHVSTPDNFWPLPSQFIGVEIELEGQSSKEMRTHNENGMPYWSEHQDASLRNGVEYVLSQPMMGSTLKEAIHYWFRTFKNYDDNPRTSIHVHINMLQDEESLEGLRNMLVLYYMFEDAFFAIADENRKWNGYCNPFEDSPPDVLVAFMREDDPSEFQHYWERTGRGNELGPRYYGLNLLALGRFGTLEFRHMPLVRDEERLFDWIKLIMELKAAANRMADDGTTPDKVFTKPDDLSKLPGYMPRFGEVLLRYIDPQVAFVRMCNINALRLDRSADFHRLEKNKAWNLYVAKQTKGGRKVVEKAAKLSKTKESSISDRLFRSIRETEAGGMGRVGGALSAASTGPVRGALPDRAADGLRRPDGVADAVWLNYLESSERAARQRVQAQPRPALRMWEEENTNRIDFADAFPFPPSEL